MAPYKKFNKVTVVTKKTEPPKKYKIGSEPKAAFNWFPGHMLKAMREIKAKLSMVDLVIEIRDARVPTISGNKSLHDAISGKGHLVVLNKVNFADAESVTKWGEWFNAQKQDHLFINCLEKSSLKTVLDAGRRIVEKKRNACNPDGVSQKQKFRFMIVGLPNTGKSTFINKIANRNATKIADKPGQTRVQLWVNVDDDLELLDTPGVVPPEMAVEEHRFWLSLINAIPDEIIGEEDPTIYLIKLLLAKKPQAFKERYKLDSFDLTVDEVITQVAKVRGALKQKGLPDVDRVYKILLQDFRAGELGKFCIEKAPSL